MIDVIKEYLVEIGFTVDKSSFQQAQQTIQKMEGTLEKFLKSFGALFKRFIDGIFENKHIRKPLESLTKFLNKIGPKIQTFLMTTRGLIIGAIGVVTAAVATFFTVATLQLHKFMSGVAQADIEVQKFARRMLLTVENARSLKAVMDAMGVKDLDELNDVAFNPELRGQFLALRQVARGLQLGEGEQGGLKTIRAFNFEFKKLGLIVDYFFQKLGGYLGQYLEGPLKDLQKFMANFNNVLMTDLPILAKELASVAGIFYKLIQLVIKLSTFIPTLMNSLLGKLFPGMEKHLGKVTDVIQFLLDLINNILDATNSFLDNVAHLRNPFGKDSNSPIKRLTYYVQRIYELLNSIWTMIKRFASDPFGFLVEKGKSAIQGMGNAIKDASEKDTAQVLKKNQGTLGYLLKVANLNNFRVTSTNTGKHTKGSKHYTNEAIDIAPEGVTPGTINGLRAAGITVLDELRRPPGEDEWSGPHYHLQITTAELAARMKKQNQTAQSAPPPPPSSNTSASASPGGIKQDVIVYINGGNFNEERLASAIKAELQSQAMISSRVQSSQFA